MVNTGALQTGCTRCGARDVKTTPQGEARVCALCDGTVDVCFASCACGRRFTADEWTALHFVGMQDDGDGGLIELRNCPCNSTIAPDEETERAA